MKITAKENDMNEKLRLHLFSLLTSIIEICQPENLFITNGKSKFLLKQIF